MNDLIYSKVPPQAQELESAVLGALIIDKGAIVEVADILSPEVFYKSEHQVIYSAIEKLYAKDKQIDLLTIVEHLRSTNELEDAGGPFYVNNLTNTVARAAHVVEHAMILKQKHIRREIIRISTLSVQMAYDDTVEDLEVLAQHEQLLEGVSSSAVIGKESTASELVTDICRVKQDQEKGIPVMFPALKNLVHNLSEPDLIILAARPSMGKTACAVQIATETAEQGYPVAVFSLEMSSRQLMCRVITSKSGVPFLRVANNEIYQNEAENFRTACNDANNLKIVIDDTAGMSEHQIKSKAIRLKKKYGIKLFVIDYLQMMHSGSKTNSREQEISNISRALKGVAKSTKTPVIALSQLSRKCEERTDKRPLMSDLRDSGAIEQDADIVVFLHRPEYYGLTEIFKDGQYSSSEGMCEVIVAKNRNGKIGSDFAKFDGNRMQFSNSGELVFFQKETVKKSIYA